MSAPKKIRKPVPRIGLFNPLTITLEFLPCVEDQDSFLIAFHGHDSRVDIVGQAVCDAIADSLGLVADEAIDFE